MIVNGIVQSIFNRKKFSDSNEKRQSQFANLSGFLNRFGLHCTTVTVDRTMCAALFLKTNVVLL